MCIRDSRDILHSMSIEQHDPAVVHQLLEFTHRYVSDIFEESRHYADYAAGGADRKEVGVEDVKLAIQTRVNFSFMQPPSRELLSELVRKKNGIPLPMLPIRPGVRLPPDKYCLTAPNYQYRPVNRPRNTQAGHVMAPDGGDAVQPPASKHRASGAQINVKIKSERM
eukprot:TRINITY_DN3454_c0_g1_i25.p2 TRINITY_DN3454_c0_g1~~TRINITY_DN3454_c0_g1_i25.p2  ORF type:complete len:167 (-),score=47.55 TRINITY_DN3454_c0_g1_i25:173-673(-)